MLVLSQGYEDSTYELVLRVYSLMENTDKQVVKLWYDNCLLAVILRYIWSLHKMYLIEKWSEKISGEGHVSLQR